MNLDDALANVTRLFLDTAPVIYFVERNPLYFDRTANIFDRIDRDEIVAVTSVITFAEALIFPLRQQNAQLQRGFEDLIVRGRNTVCLPIGIDMSRRRDARTLQHHADRCSANRRRSRRRLRSLPDERVRLAACQRITPSRS